MYSRLRVVLTAFMTCAGLAGCTDTELRDRVLDAGSDAEAPLEDGAIRDDSSMPAMDGEAPMPDASDGDSSAPMPDGSTDSETPDPDSSVEDGGDDAGDGSVVPVDPPAGCSAAERALASAQIALARSAADGAIDVEISHALVTGVIPAIGVDPAGFTIQAELTGPAIFVRVDPSTLTPAPKKGDCIAITLEEILTINAMRFATLASDFSLLGEGHDLALITQDVSTATDVASALSSYEAELLSVQGTLVSTFGYGGADHVRADLATVGIPAGDLVFRIPAGLELTLDLVESCEIRVLGTPFWVYNTTPEISAWRAEEIAIDSCPAPRVTSAQATNSTTVVIRFDRHIDPSSVSANGSQFVFTSGLTASAASVDAGGMSVTLTTAAQTGSAAYGVAVTTGVRDMVGTALASDALGASFLGFAAPAVVRINEVNANIANGCDLVELRVEQGGNMDALELWHRDGVAARFPLLAVEDNDFVIVHFGDHATCNDGSGNETSSRTQYPLAIHATNYDTAYDWFAPNVTLVNSTNTLLLRTTAGTIVDAVLLSDGLGGTATASAEARAAEAAGAGEWTATNGSVPIDGFIDGVFREHSVLDLNATGTDATGVSIQRVDDTDRNHKGDWNGAVMPASTWGMNNAGQVDF